MRKARSGILVGLLCASVALGGCATVQSAGEQADQARDQAGRAIGEATDAAGNAVSKSRACAEALGITRALPDSQDLAQFRAEAGERAQRLRELGRTADGTDVRNALFRVADFFVQLEQRKAQSLGELNTWAQRNINRFDDLRQICL